jgi:hypothetical protein
MWSQSNFGGLYSVNSVAWNGSEWLLGGGTPVASYSFLSSAFLYSYNSTRFSNLTPSLPSYIQGANSDSSILSIATSSSRGSWVIGGYAGSTGILLVYNGTAITDLSNLTGGHELRKLGRDFSLVTLRALLPAVVVIEFFALVAQDLLMDRAWKRRSIHGDENGL